MINLNKEEKVFLISWFENILSHELTEEQLQQYQQGLFDSLFDFLSEQGFTEQVKQIKNELGQLHQMPYAHLELAADFTQLFLLDGQVSALPYASAYLEDKALDDNLHFMDQLLKDFSLQVSRNNKEPSDHLAVYLEVLDKLVQESSLDEQQDFIKNYLLTWLTPFNKRVQNIRTKTMFYQHIMALFLSILSK
ncbi:Tat proofreading chaperone TorD [Bisgaardia hudsonensis]|uniref:Tat proofreading chaperone TorD n=1 Tax=Bisgaardia hudsonensis TaxID=109472 RepID=A0A4R2MT29_9PAST|nr:molecular chaperone TorD [Bisgaardia hudsonensis]QLB12114.1 molecular chaperone TorD [Bisgaardia hudsonensis]TCP11472.1 Tat proofreading chaperone TorD [Bisgaardia hudsonensis]